MNLRPSHQRNAFTLIEMLIVIAIIATLATLSMPVYRQMTEKAEMVKHVSNVKNLTMHTIQWASDNSQTLPSPQYPGGHSQSDPAIPEQWDFAKTGSGLWLDGVIYYAVMFAANNERAQENKDNESYKEVTEVDGQNGAHLKDTIFFSQQSFKKNPLAEDMHQHSYAMNRSLQYDYLYKNSSDPELTNKNMTKIPHPALLYTENQDSNVIGFEDREAIIETGKKRWSSKKIICSFLDGSCNNLSATDIPSEDMNSDRQSSRFWRGVDPD